MITERDVERRLIRLSKRAGFLIRKTAWIGHNHAPDRLIMTPGATVWVELKAPGRKARPGQVREHERMRAAGQRVDVIDTKEGVDELINELIRLNDGKKS